MHCFASENQTYTGPWLLALSLVFKGQETLLLKNLQVKTRVENVRFLSWTIFFVGKYGIQSTNEMAFQRTVTLRASSRFPAIRFDAPTLLSFSGFTHAHAKCPPVMIVIYNHIKNITDDDRLRTYLLISGAGRLIFSLSAISWSWVGPLETKERSHNDYLQ